MVSITKRTVQGKIYHYLSYSYKENDKVLVIEKSIGREIPSVEILEKIKEEFICDIVVKRWIPFIDDFNEKYNKKLEEQPKILKTKNLKDFGVRFTHHSNKIEGSTLTLREVAAAINEKDVIIKKPVYEINEAQLHMKCYEDMVSTTSELSLELIIKWHEILFSLHIDRSNLAGIVRKGDIYIQGSKHVPPTYPQPLLDDLFWWYNEKKDKIHPVLLACLMHYRFEFIHPFSDGNGRMGRLLMNYILFKNNYLMFNIPAKIKLSYYHALERSDLSEDEMHFVGWFFRTYIKSFEDIII